MEVELAKLANLKRFMYRFINSVLKCHFCRFNNSIAIVSNAIDSFECYKKICHSQCNTRFLKISVSGYKSGDTQIVSAQAPTSRRRE